MASIFVKTGGDFSGLTFQKVAYDNFNQPYTTASYPAGTALNTEQTTAFTPSEAGDCEGVLVHLKIKENTAGESVTVKLQELVGAVWTDRASKTLTYEEIIGAKAAIHTPVTGTGLGGITKYFEFTSVYAVTAVASTWRISMLSTTDEALILPAIGGGWTLAVILATATTYTAADNIYMAHNITITVDQSITATKWHLSADGKLNWDTTPASAYTLTITSLYYSLHSSFECGEEDTPIPYAQQANISITNNLATFHWSAWMNYYVKIYGEVPTDVLTTTATTSESGQKDMVLTDDYSATWVATDVLGIYHSGGYSTGTIDSISGTTVTLTTNLSHTFRAGYKVVNITRSTKCGVMLGANFGFTSTSGILSEIELQGIYRDGKSLSITVSYGGGWIDTIGRTLIKAPKISHVYGGTLGGTCSFTNSVPTSLPEFSGVEGARPTISNIISAQAGTSRQFSTSGLSNASFSNIHVGGYLSTLNLTANSSTFTDISACPTWAGYNYSYFSVAVDGAANTFTRLYACCTAPIINGVDHTFIDSRVDRCTYAMQIYSSAGGIVWRNSEFGLDVVNTYTVGYIDGTYGTVLFDNCKNSDTNPVIYVNLAVGSSEVKFANFNQSAVDHRTYKVFGSTQSTGDGLTDTTVHTSGTGKFALRFEPTSSTDSLTWDIDVPTGDISTKTMTVSVWCKINSATYYAGTHQLPRLKIDYDNGTTAYHQAGETTDWQLLFVTFTPTTTYGQITVTLSGRTDATSTDAYIYWDDFGLAYPPSVALDLGGMDNWSNGLPVVPPVSIPISAGTVAQEVWKQLTTTSYGTNSMGEQVKAIPAEIKYIDSGELPIY